MNILILIIENDKYMNETLQYVLKSEGYNVKSSLNALEAIKILKSSGNKYDLLIVDYNLQYLKGINGFDIYEIAKENNPDLKAIMVTAYASDKKIKKEAMSKGIDVLIEKPFLISDLIDAIEYLEIIKTKSFKKNNE
jgi:CheY-like chemotaxis protein